MAQHELPVPDYDHLPLTELRHRVRSLAEPELRVLVDHEREHGDRVPVLEVLRARLAELRGGAEPSPGDPRAIPEASRPAGRSPVDQSTAAEPTAPLRHGQADQTPSHGRR
ncbi:hypothetical protein [Actinophytocola glycyrrhizae]|uniref:DUF8129 domain-containing protein n=1 Tax=Actinophytocola glycyrrhizae TaxID=2044873 RepID=A0ABV9RVX2_9PSEU